MIKITVKSSDLTEAEWLALLDFAKSNGNQWRKRLAHSWNAPSCNPTLKSVRDKQGATWLLTLTIQKMKWALAEYKQATCTSETGY